MSFKNYKKSIVLNFDYESVKKGVPETKKQMALLNSEISKQMEEARQSGSSINKLTVSHEGLSNKVKIQTNLIASLKKELEDLTNAEKRNERAILDKTIDLNDAEANLMKYEKKLKEVNNEINRQNHVFSSATEKIEEFQNRMNLAGVDLESLGKGITSLGVGMTAMVTLPLVALGKVSTDAYIEFESAFAGVRKTVDATEKQFKELEKGIRDMSKEIPSTSSEIAKVAETAGQLGIATGNILSFTRTMIDLGQATNMSSEQAATSLARLANITQMSQKDFDRLGSTIVALGNNLATTESEIVDMGLRLAGAGKQVGLSEAQILSFAGALSSVGIEAEAGGSAFSKVMINMQLATEKGGKELRDFAKVAGMSGLEFKKAFQEDASKALLAFIEGLGKAQERGQSTIKILDDMGITEVRLRDALLRAAGANNVFADSLEIGTKAWEENTALANEAAERYATLESRIQTLKNKLSDIVLTIGGSVAPVLSDMIDILTPFANVLAFLVDIFNMIPEPIRKIIVVAGLFLALIGPLLTIVGKVVEHMNGIPKKINDVGNAVSTLTGFVGGLNPTLLKAVGIFLLVASALAVILALITAIKGNAGQLTDIADSMNRIQQPINGLQSKVNDIPNYAIKGSHRSGLGKVPYDGYVGLLHQDEEVLTANDPRNQNNPNFKWGQGGGDIINITIDAKNVDDFNKVVDLAKNFRQTKRAGVL